MFDELILEDPDKMFMDAAGLNLVYASWVDVDALEELISKVYIIKKKSRCVLDLWKKFACRDIYDNRSGLVFSMYNEGAAYIYEVEPKASQPNLRFFLGVCPSGAVTFSE